MSTTRSSSAVATLGVRGVASILGRYFRGKAAEQLKAIWFIITYLLVFQVLILRLPVIHSVSIALGVVLVVIGLTFFMEGLRLGLMPFGETIGAILPRNSRLPLILGFAFVLGVGATFAEPAISVLKRTGSGVSPAKAPLLYSLLNDFSGQLVAAVGVGVGVAVALGVLRFFYGWSLKYLILPLVGLLSCMTLVAYFDPLLNPIIGLAWDCGAVTTGPVTVPLVLALGIGVCRIVGNEDSGSAGFGIVTLASLFPVLAVLLLGIAHLAAEDYYGAPRYAGERASVATHAIAAMPDLEARELPLSFSEAEFLEYRQTRQLKDSKNYITHYRGGDVTLEDGRIVHRDAEIVLEKREPRSALQEILRQKALRPWNPQTNVAREALGAMTMSLQAILPLCGLMLLTLLVVLRERLRKADEIALGVAFSVVGMALFGLGLSLGLTPLATQVGSNIPATFAAIEPWGLSGAVRPLVSNPVAGKVIAVLFAFFLGYGATLAEPALHALGYTVEDVTVGVFSKKLLMQVVAVGVGVGIAAGVAQLAFPALSLTMLLIPPYLLLMFLTMISSEEFVSFAWDSAGVTTGPITVPLVLAMGLGIGARIPGVSDGFGILALASVGPIITVLTVGLIVGRSQRVELSTGPDAVV